MSLVINQPNLNDIEQLLRLYQLVYGNTYPIAYGADPKTMADAMKSDDHLWLVMRDSAANEGRGKLVGSLVIEVDRTNKIGKAVALVVHPDYRKQHIASRLVERGSRDLIAANGPLNSIYATTRTLAAGAQLTFLRNGYLPLGIFPNAHKLKQWETITLMAKFKPGVLEGRDQLPTISAKLARIYEAAQHYLGAAPIPETKPETTKAEAQGATLESRRTRQDSDLDFEFIFAPHYVLRRFHQAFQDPYDRFFPFHHPNTLIAAANDEIEIYAHFSRSDGYCAIVALTHPVFTLEGRMHTLLDRLREHGASYVEFLIGIDRTESIETLFNNRFLPSAVYPAMRQTEDGRYHDFVLLSRTAEPLDFQGMAIERSFKPYIDQYVDQWKKAHLDILEVIDESHLV